MQGEGARGTRDGRDAVWREERGKRRRDRNALESGHIRTVMREGSAPALSVLVGDVFLWVSISSLC